MLGPGPEPFKIQGGSSKHDPRRSRRRSRPILLINRSSVARAVLHNLLHWLTDWLTDSAFSSEPSKHHYTETVRPRELTVWENVHPPPHITCHVSHVKCHVSGIMCHCQVSGVTCQVSQFVIYFFWTKWLSYFVEDLLSTGPYLSSFLYWNCKYMQEQICQAGKLVCRA